MKVHDAETYTLNNSLLQLVDGVRDFSPVKYHNKNVAEVLSNLEMLTSLHPDQGHFYAFKSFN